MHEVKLDDDVTATFNEGAIVLRARMHDNYCSIVLEPDALARLVAFFDEHADDESYLGDGVRAHLMNRCPIVVRASTYNWIVLEPFMLDTLREFANSLETA